ncbi:50S ribosomal protein L4 [Candidatus Falkowbacteria bacterium]|nr:50S ribosomal protein L4 [Candidatus Falkowbacteria bacterium]
MTKVKLYNQKAESVGEQELSDRIFAVTLNQGLVHQAVVTQLANERQVLAHTKGRSDVRGGGKKPWRQKGTGRARAGSSRSPIWIGGGVTFGPLNNRNFTKKINKKMKQQALFMTLTDKVKSNQMLVLDKIEFTEAKTKPFAEMLKNLETKAYAREGKTKRSVLVVLPTKHEFNILSGRNLAGVEVINLDNLNIVDVLKYRDLVITADGIKKLEARLK